MYHVFFSFYDMRLLMISGDRSLQHGRKGAFHGLLEEFRTHWDRIDVICPHDVLSDLSPDAKSFSPMDKVFVHPGKASVFRQPSFIVHKGRELIAQHHHDVMTVHDFPPFYNGRGAKKLSRITGVPANLEIHHLVGYPRPASWREAIGRWMTEWMIGRHSWPFASVRTVNSDVSDALVRFGVDRKKISVVPSVYLDHTLYAGLQSVEKTYDLVFCGRLVENKGLFSVLHAMRELQDRTLLVIGDGPEHASATEYVLAHGLEHRVRFVGWLPGAGDVMRSIASGKIFVMNSASEGNPRVAVEAMAAGLPVLATRVGIMPDILKNGVNGMFTNGSPKDIAEKAKQLLCNEKTIVAMGNEAKKVMETFEKTKAIKAYAEFLKRVRSM